MRKFVLILAVFALPLVLIGVEGQTQEADPFWVTFSSEFHAPPEFFTVSVFGNGGDVDQFNFGGIDLVSNPSQGFAVNQEFSDEFSQVGNSLEACDSGLQISGSAFFEVLDIRVGQRWEGEVVLGENRSICVDLMANPEFGGDYLIFEIRFRATTDGNIFFNSKPESVTASFNGVQFDPINVLLHKVEVDVP